MSADRIAAPGTDESTWAPWLATRRWPEWVPDPSWRRVAVCAAHPDDEVLGAGGTMALLAGAGVALTLVSVTDGEASHPASTVVDPAALAARRVRETAGALTVLGVDASVVRLGLPDSGLSGRVPELTGRLAGALAGVDAVLTVWSGDAHPDHEAVGRAALTAAAGLGLPIWQFPVWAWHWARPDDARVPWARAELVRLPAGVRAAKRAAVAAFTSQVEPLGPAPADAAVLSPGFLAHVDRDCEVLLR